MYTAVKGLTISNNQFALPLAFDRQYSFANFYLSADESGLLLDEIRKLIEGKGEKLIGIWGREDSGKTHLVNACAVYAHELSFDFQSYDAVQLREYSPEDIGQWSESSLIFIDNLDCLCGRDDWELVLYQLINMCRQGELRCIFSSSLKPSDIPCQLNDLKSRLVWGLLIQLPEMNDMNLRSIIRLRAGRIGLDVSDDVLNFLLTRMGRRVKDQIELLEKLDKASLIHQKKITIPFIKQILG